MHFCDKAEEERDNSRNQIASAGISQTELCLAIAHAYIENSRLAQPNLLVPPEVLCRVAEGRGLSQ